MDYLAEHKRMLQRAASNELPVEIGEDSALSVRLCRELYEAGFLDAVDGRSMGGDAFLDPRITVAGREYLNELERRASEASPAGKARRIGLRLVDLGLGVLAGLLLAWASGKLIS